MKKWVFRFIVLVFICFSVSAEIYPIPKDLIKEEIDSYKSLGAKLELGYIAELWSDVTKKTNTQRSQWVVVQTTYISTPMPFPFKLFLVRDAKGVWQWFLYEYSGKKCTIYHKLYL